MTTTQMYWLVTLDGIHNAVVVLGTLSLAAFLVTFVRAMNEEIKWRVPLSLGITSFVMMLVLVFVPSTKRMAAILVVPKIVNSEKVQTVGDELYNLAVEWMEELHPKRLKSKGEDNGRK